MQTIKPAQTIKYTTFVIHYSVTVAPQNLRRPAPTDPRREAWNRAAKLIWHCIIILTSLVIAFILRAQHVDVEATTALVADRAPEMIQDFVEYFKNL